MSDLNNNLGYVNHYILVKILYYSWGTCGVTKLLRVIFVWSTE